MMFLFYQINIIFFFHLLNAVIGQNLQQMLQKEAAEAGTSYAGIKRNGEDKMLVMDKKDGSSQEITRLEDFLVKSWRELDRMLYCTKIPRCVMAYKKRVRVRSKETKFNLIQSIGITLRRIKDLTGMLRQIKR